MMANAPPDSADQRRHIRAWYCYDWANSGYTTLLITVFAVYIQKAVFPSVDDDTMGPVVWAWTIAVSMLIGAVLSPILGAWADARANKRGWLAGSAVCGGVFCISMAVMPVEWPWAVVGCLLAANICLEISLTFYNGFLPEIASDEEMNRVSAIGMACGYFGGGLCLLLAMFLLWFGPGWGWGNESFLLRVAIAFTGVWWIVFSVPTIYILRDQPRSHQPGNQTARAAWQDFLRTFGEIRSDRALLLFLVGFLFFNDGVQTVISQASTFALRDLKFSSSELVGLILMIQFVATPGAVVIGKLADRMGLKPTLQICLIIWIVLLASAWVVTTKFWFWVMAVGVAFVLGGTQSISRAIMGILTPPQKEARYFGFFNLSGKATSFMGTFLFGLVVWLSGSARLAIVNLIVFFVIGLILISMMKLDDRH